MKQTFYSREGCFPRGSKVRGGFTLIEVLFAISLVAIVVGIVYESFSAVTDATAEARLQGEELRIREFLTRSFSNSFSTVYIDPAFLNEEYNFVGEGSAGGSGSSDTVEFCSSAPLMGGTAPPGFYKRIHYGAASQGSSMTLGKGDSAKMEGLASSTVVFEATETLVAMTAPQLEKSDFSKERSQEDVADAFGMSSESPAWTAPIAALDFSFYDGEEWVEEWNAFEMQRMPWCVRIRVNFARTEEEYEGGDTGSNISEDPDFEMIIPIPIGVGVWTPADQWVEMVGYGSNYGSDALQQQQGAQNGTNKQPNAGNDGTRPSQAGGAGNTGTGKQ